MSKRRNRKNRPNLPEDVLARARREAGIEAEEAPPEEVESPEAPRRSRPEPPAQRRNRDDLPQVQQQRRKRRESDPKEMTHAEVYEKLAHPTRDVTEAELHTQYGYVLSDLRSMGVLAGLLFVLMIVVARFL